MGQFDHLADVDGLNVIALPIRRSDSANANRDGMQEAHLTGVKLYNEDLTGLRNETDPFGIGTSEMPSNGVLAPETQTGSKRSNCLSSGLFLVTSRRVGANPPLSP